MRINFIPAFSDSERQRLASKHYYDFLLSKGIDMKESDLRLEIKIKNETIINVTAISQDSKLRETVQKLLGEDRATL